MLFLVGTGLSYYDISVGAAEACKGCAAVFIDTYTSFIDDAKIGALTRIIGKEIGKLKREDMEDKARELVEGARSKDIAVLTGGDPLVATTHKILFIEAKRAKVEVKVYHSSNIMTSAIGESGLDFYRFGAVCTIPRWTANYKPLSFYETIEKNSRQNNHSLILLDYDQEGESTISVKEAVARLEDAEKSYNMGIISNDKRLIIMKNLGLEGESVKFITVKAAKEDSNKGMAAIILPAEISAVEKETMQGMQIGD